MSPSKFEKFSHILIKKYKTKAPRQSQYCFESWYLKIFFWKTWKLCAYIKIQSNINWPLFPIDLSVSLCDFCDWAGLWMCGVVSRGNGWSYWLIFMWPNSLFEIVKFYFDLTTGPLSSFCNFLLSLFHKFFLRPCW